MTSEQIIYCDECDKEFPLVSVQIQESDVEIEGQVFRLVYFTCPKCNKIYRVSLKDDKYEQLKEDLEQAKKRIRRNNGRNNLEFQRTLSSMAQKKLERLQNYTSRLNNRFNGTFTFASESKDKIIYLP
ncbi:MAG: hypothetical protein KBT03_03590 [Bacteroidales bacterium]|nr:hypothetical protein [Candidatus Scybalousia scybalohippi]